MEELTREAPTLIVDEVHRFYRGNQAGRAHTSPRGGRYTHRGRDSRARLVRGDCGLRYERARRKPSPISDRVIPSDSHHERPARFPSRGQPYNDRRNWLPDADRLNYTVAEAADTATNGIAETESSVAATKTGTERTEEVTGASARQGPLQVASAATINPLRGAVSVMTVEITASTTVGGSTVTARKIRSLQAVVMTVAPRRARPASRSPSLYPVQLDYRSKSASGYRGGGSRGGRLSQGEIRGITCKGLRQSILTVSKRRFFS